MNVRLVCCLCAAAWLSGCVSPNPYRGGPAPVVDRSSVVAGYNAPSAGTPRAVDRPDLAPGIEVTPLDEPSALPLGPSEMNGELVVEDLPAAQPSGPPTVTRRPKPEAPAAPATQAPNEAVVALLDSAAEHVAQQDLDKAAADLERAVRIEPNNAAIWHDLGQIRLHQSRYDDAMAMASKSTGLASANRALKARNWRIIAIARRSLGDDVGADAAEATAVQLER